MKKIIVLLLAVIMLCALVSCDNKDKKDNIEYPEYTNSAAASGAFYNTANTGASVDIDMSKVKAEIGAYKYEDFVKADGVTDFVVIRVKGYGDMVAVLRPDVAPVTVENFKKLVSENFFENIVFHRVYKDFMIQGGGMYADGKEKDAASIKGEFTSNGHTNNLLHEAGVLSMARTNAPNSASSQFFIMHKYSEHLDGSYASFGYVLAGMDVLEKIANSKVQASAMMNGEMSDPVEDIVIESVFFVKPVDSTKLGTENEYKPCEHEFGEWETTKEASCSSTGAKQRICTLCNRKDIATVEKTAHNYPLTWEDVTIPTCTEYGSASRKCADCDSVETERIDKLAHTFVGDYCTECSVYDFWKDVTVAGGRFDTTTTGAGTQIDMSKVSEQIDAYESADFVRSEEITDFVVLKIKDYGDVVIALRSDVAPDTVANFKKLVSEEFYTDIIFHRVIENFMIQGGYKTSEGGTKKADSIVGEFESNGHENKLNHIAGVISMARTSEPDSASSQFFIMHGDASYLDGQYAAFGYVLAGLDVVDAIAKCEVKNPSSQSPSPVNDVVIEEAYFVTMAITG